MRVVMELWRVSEGLREDDGHKFSVPNLPRPRCGLQQEHVEYEAILSIYQRERRIYLTLNH